jgi:cytochrome c-type biogenesis protein CcmH
MSAVFWFIAGVLAGVTAALIAVPLWRVSVGSLQRRPLRYAIAAGAVVVFAASAALVYLAIGSPHALDTAAHVALPPAHPGAAQSTSAQAAAGGKALSMETATAGLEARLTRDGGSASDWLLLAQSYEFLGRADDAKRAREHAGGAAPGSMTPASPALVGKPSGASLANTNVAALWNAATSQSAGSSEPRNPPDTPQALSVAQLERQIAANPRDAQSWLALADLYRRQRDYDKARAAFVQAVGLKGMNATAWADYADVLGSVAGGSLNVEAGRAIDRALALDPANAKALWLKASRAHQEQRYGDALTLWKKLRTVLPPDSSDLRLVDANIEEASQLARTPPTQSAKDARPAAPVAITGTVSIESRLAKRVERDATLFIYAKAVDSPGAPLAVVRINAGSWPVSFRLDDSMAMIPSRKLSQFDKVVIEARISRTGQAAPASGDLYVTSDVLQPSAGKNLALIINHEIG